LLALSSAMMTAGIGALACVTQYTPGLGQGLSFLGGLGTGGIIQPAVTILTIISPDEVIATITAITISTRLVGASIGYSVYFNTLQKTLATSIPEKVGTAVVKAGLPPGEIALFMGALLGGNSTMLGGYALNVVAAAQEAMIDSYTEAFRLVYLVSIPFGVCAVIACLFLGDIKKYMSDRVAVDIH
jgi:Fungal trichothecene efflux pump (TRI12)